MGLAALAAVDADVVEGRGEGDLYIGLRVCRGGRMTLLSDSRETVLLCDVQSSGDDRGFPIDQVGVSELRHPIIVLDRQDVRQQTTATLLMSVSLPHQFKGTHMSRFVELLNAHRGELTMRTL